MNPLREKMKNKKNLSIFVTYYIGKKIHSTKGQVLENGVSFQCLIFIPRDMCYYVSCVSLQKSSLLTTSISVI